MTTRYSLPEGASSASADGIHFAADDNGHIDVTGAHPTTIATLVQFAGARPVRSEEEIAKEAEDAAERVRFEAAVAEMMKGSVTILQAQAQSQAQLAADQAEADRAKAAAATSHEAAAAERTLREAIVAAAPVEQVTPPEAADGEASSDAPADAETSPAAPGGVIPPKRRAAKNG